jgi:hypothetical protein
MREATPVFQGFCQERAASAQANFNTRGAGGDWTQRRGPSPFGFQEPGEAGADRPAPYAPLPLRSHQIPYQGNFGMGNINPLKNQYQQFVRETQQRQPAHPQFGPQQPCNIYDGQQEGMIGNNQYQAQGPMGGGVMQQPNQPFVNQGAAHQVGAPGVGSQQPGWTNQGGPAGFTASEMHQGPFSGEDGRARSGVADSERGRQGAQERGSSTKEVMERLASFEKKLNIQSARVGIKAELRRQLAQINPEENPGLFAQMDIASTIYSAPRS